MSGTAWIALMPLIIVGGASVVVMLALTIRRSYAWTVWLTLSGLAAAFASLWPAASVTPRHVTLLLVVDRYAIFYMGLILAACFAVVLISYGYFKKQRGQREELYILMLLATLGSQVLVTSTHFVSLFLGLEILSVSLYALIAYQHTKPRSLEAGIKYLVLAASSAAFLLFGMALIYAALGTMQFGEIATRLASQASLPLGIFLPGTALLITGIGFKLGVVPFHLWTPDVYEGASAPVTAFIATVSKGSMFALLLRYFYGSSFVHVRALYVVFAIMAIASMFAGNLLALMQNNVKRILAYSSIAHLGYLLVAFLAGGHLAVEAVTFYLVAYFITTLGAFGVVAVLSDREGEAELINDYRGLFWRRPLLAGIFTIVLLSLAGIPVTAGFLAKFFIIAAGASASSWALILILVVTSVMGLFYYLRIVVMLYADLPNGAERTETPVLYLPLSGTFTVTALAILLVWFGIYPTQLLELIRTFTAKL